MIGTGGGFRGRQRRHASHRRRVADGGDPPALGRAFTARRAPVTVELKRGPGRLHRRRGASANFGTARSGASAPPRTGFLRLVVTGSATRQVVKRRYLQADASSAGASAVGGTVRRNQPNATWGERTITRKDGGKRRGQAVGTAGPRQAGGAPPPPPPPPPPPDRRET